jgi:hypothetical protein
MSYFNDFGADDPNIDLTQYVLAPQCIIPEYNGIMKERIFDVFPKFYWSTHITGPYATGAVSRYLRSIGCDPIKLVEPAPIYSGTTFVGAHTFYSDPNNKDQKIYHLSRDLLYELDRIPPPPNVSGWADSVVEIKKAIANRDENRLKLWCQSLRLMINGYKHGLCAWPPAQFRNQAHLDAWIAHNFEWRYGWKPLSRKGESVMFEGQYGQVLKPWTVPEHGTGVVRSVPPNDINKLFSSTLAQWPKYESEIISSLNKNVATSAIRRYFPYLTLNDEVGAKLFILHSLLCIQMAYYAESRNVPNAFPGADGLPHFRDDGGLSSVFGDMFKSLFSIGLSIKGGPKAFLGSTTSAMLGMYLKGMSSSTYGNLSVVMDPRWTPAPIHISKLTDPKACYRAGISTTPKLTTMTFSPTLMKALVPQQTFQPKVATTFAFKPGTLEKLVDLKIQEQKKPFPYLLAGAAGLGAYLLLRRK